MTRRAGALLPVHLLAGSIDLGAVLDVMRAALTLGELPAHAAMQDIGPRLQAKDRVRQINRTRRRAVERYDLELHFRRPPSRPAERRRWALPRLGLRELASPAGGICPAWARRPAISSSRRHEE